MPLRVRAFLFLCIFALVTTVSLIAQTNTTMLSGSVTDATGAAIRGATITILNPGNGATQTDTSDGHGDYAFNQIVPGKYVITVHTDGFTQQVVHAELLVNSPAKISFKLSAGSNQSIDVESTASTVNSTDATLGKPFDQTQIQTLPYLANNVLSLLSLQPGVLQLNPTPAGNQDIRSGIVNGARQDQSNVTLDGVDDNDQVFGYAFTGVLRATRDSVEEFRVVTAGADADSGRSSGAQVSLVTKSGTNKLHGSAYEYYRDPAAASNDWFLKQSQVSKSQPNVPAKILQHTYGATLGLPFLKDKLFFFGAYEGFQQRSNTVVTQTVPLGLRNGTMTYLNAGGTYTTLTPALIAAMDTKCTGNGTCPLGAGTNPAAVAYFNKFPVSNSNAVGDLYNTAGYVFAAPAPVSNVTNIARLDYNLSGKQVLFVRGNLQGDNVLTTPQFPGVAANTNTYDNSRGLTAGHIWSISSALVNNFRYGWVRQGTAAQGSTNQDYVTFAAFSNLLSTNTSTVALVQTHNFVDDFTITKGRHTIQFGTNERLIYNSQLSTKSLYKVGTVTTSYLTAGAIANNPGASLDATTAYNKFGPNSGYQPIASSYYTQYNTAMSAVTGLLTHAQETVNFGVQGNQLVALPAGLPPTRHYRSNELEFYAQDVWKVSNQLTLTAGLRYSYLGVPYESNGQEVIPTTNLHTFFQNRIAGMSQGVSDNELISFGPGGSANGQPNLWNPGKANFAPRVAFAWSTANGRSSVRGGFGLNVDHFGEQVINTYNNNGAFGLSTVAQNGVNQGIDTTPRFADYHTVPTSIIPTPPTAGSFPVTFATGVGAIYTSVDPNIKTPYAETFNLTLQREVVHGLTFTATYTGRLGRHLLTRLDLATPLNLTDPASGVNYFQASKTLDQLVDQKVPVGNVPNMPYWQNMFPNASVTVGGTTYKGTQAVYQNFISKRGNETAVLSALDTTTAASPGGQSFRYFHKQFASLYSQTAIGVSNYQGAQFSVRQTLRHGLQYDFNYTLSKSMDMGSAPERSNSDNIINAFNPSLNYAPSDFDARHVITSNWILASPFGRGGTWFTNDSPLVDRLIGGFSLTGVLHWSSGLPFSSTESGWATDWAVQGYNVQTGPVISGGHHSYLAAKQVVNAFPDPVAAAANIRLPYPGEAGQRNNYRADGYFSVDPGVSKSFRILAEHQLKLSVEAFNVFNSVRFNTLVTAGQSTTYGNYSTVLTPPRQMQFSGHYTF